MNLYTHTLRGIFAQRRMVPITIVCVPMIALEGNFVGPRGALLAIIIFAGFLAIGPASYRALFPVHMLGRQRALRVLGFALVTLAYVVLFGFLLPQLLGVSRSILTDPVTLFSSGPLFWAGSWALGRDIQWEESMAAIEARNAALSREAERAQLLALRTHLDPHFLFNTLNAIAEWCRDDPAVAERATLQLSAMLRTILTGVKAPAWPLSSEIELVQQLLELHKARDPERFAYDLAIDDAARRVPIPPMLLLSLVENAVKHGPAAGHRGAITLEAALASDKLCIALSNPGAYSGPRAEGEGLPIARKRLKLAYDGAASMTHTSEAERTTVELRLPLVVSGEAV